MRKALAWLLLLTLVMSVFAGCGNKDAQPTTEGTEPTTEVTEDQTYTGPSAQDAMEYLESLYQNEGATIGADYSRYSTIRVGGEAFDVVWTASLSEDMIKVVDNGDGTCTIDINEECEAETPYVLTATITDPNGESASHSWNYILPEGVSAEEIINAAYALKDGEVLPYQATLRGKVVSIDTVYDPDYKNVTVTIAAEGFEKKPIKCYRLKGEGVDKIVAGNIITVTGTIKNYKGTIEFDAGCIMDKWEEGTPITMPTDPLEIIDMIYELPRGASLAAPVTLTGYITSVDTPYDPGYGNITVTIAIPGRLNKPIMCYRMKGENLDKLKTSDEITVTGTIVNYQGTREFNAGCQLVKCVPGSGHTQPKDPVKVVEEAYNLPLAGNLLYDAELTGTIKKINTKYSASYGNITVTIVVKGAEDKPIECYRMTGDNSKLAKLKVGDEITVKGLIKNYYSFSNNTSKIQYDKPVMLDCVFNGGSTDPQKTAMKPVAEPKTGVAYKFGMKQNNISGKPYQMITGDMDGYYYETVTDASMAKDVYLEKSGDGYSIYYMKGNDKVYLNIIPRDTDATKTNVVFQTAAQGTPSVYTLNTQHQYVYTTVNGTDWYLGTYSSYVTVSASKTSLISDTSKIGVSQFCAWFLEVDPNGGAAEPEVPGTTVTTTLVEKPEAGTAYKFGMLQGNLNKTYYITGDMDGYYMGTVEDAATAADVYLEETTGGYYLYTTAGGKQYINMVISGTHVNAAFEATASTVYTYNAEKKTVTAVVNGEDYWHGTRNDKTYTTAGPVKVSYEGFYCQFYTATVTGGGATTGTPTVTDKPVAGTAYKFGMLQGNLNKTYFITGDMDGYYMGTTEDAAAAADVYLEETTGGYYLYTTAGGKQYINMVISGTHVNAAFEATASTVYTYNAEKKTVTAVVNGEDYWHGTRNDKTYTTAGPVKVSYEGFYCQFYTLTGGSTGGNEGGNQGGNTGTTTGTPTVVDAPVAGTAYKFGMLQGNLSKTYFITGDMDGYYMGTVEDAAAAADVYLEETTGGYYLYTTAGGKKYINMVVSGTYVNAAFEATASTVYTYNAQKKTVTAVVNGTDYWHGTRNDKTFTTAGPVKVSYDGFYCQFYTLSSGSTGGNTGSGTGGNTGTMTAEQIVNAAYALGEGEALEGTQTLTGKVYSVDTPYDATFKNVTVTMIVGNLNTKPIQCFRMKGTGADVIKAGYTITVTGTLKNYFGTVEFDAGCSLDSYVAGTAPEVTTKADATITFDNTSKRTSVSTQQQVWKENGITFTNDKAGSTSNINETYFNPVRLYKGTSATISYTKAMTKIEIECDTSAYATTLANSITAGNGVSVSVNVKTVVITFTSGVTTFTVDAMSAQVRVKNIKVYC